MLSIGASRCLSCPGEPRRSGLQGESHRLPSPPAPPRERSDAPRPTDVVLFFAGDGVAADLSVLDGRQIPAGDQSCLLRLPLSKGLGAGGRARGRSGIEGRGGGGAKGGARAGAL